MARSTTKVILLSEKDVKEILSKHIMEQGYAIRSVEFDVDRSCDEAILYGNDQASFKGASITVLA